MDEADRQQVIDAEHLKLLRIGFLISGIMSCLFALFPLIYVAFGVMIAVVVPGGHDDGPPPAAIGAVIAVVGIAISAIIGASAALKLLAARAIGKRRSRGLCYVAAGLACLDVPFGTLLGICTFMVLSRPSVERLFSAPAPLDQVSAPGEYRPLFSSRDHVDSQRP